MGNLPYVFALGVALLAAAVGLWNWNSISGEKTERTKADELEASYRKAAEDRIARLEQAMPLPPVETPTTTE